jgi:hypothetical protein
MSNSISNLKEKETVRWGLGKSVFPERSRHRSLKYFAEKLQQPEFQAKITGIKHQ